MTLEEFKTNAIANAKPYSADDIEKIGNSGYLLAKDQGATT
jgi:hypothetical protein